MTSNSVLHRAHNDTIDSALSLFFCLLWAQARVVFFNTKLLFASTFMFLRGPLKDALTAYVILGDFWPNNGQYWKVCRICFFKFDLWFKILWIILKMTFMAFSVFCKCVESTKEHFQEWDLLGPPFDAADQVGNSISSGLIARMGIWNWNNVAPLNHSNMI